MTDGTDGMDDRRAAGELRRMVDRHEDRLAQMSTVPSVLQDIDRRMRDTEQRLGAMDTRLYDNTQITQQIRDAQIAGKVLGKVIGWISVVAAAAATVWGAIYQITHNGKLP